MPRAIRARATDLVDLEPGGSESPRTRRVLRELDAGRLYEGDIACPHQLLASPAEYGPCPLTPPDSFPPTVIIPPPGRTATTMFTCSMFGSLALAALGHAISSREARTRRRLRPLGSRSGAKAGRRCRATIPLLVRRARRRHPNSRLRADRRGEVSAPGPPDRAVEERIGRPTCASAIPTTFGPSTPFEAHDQLPGGSRRSHPRSCPCRMLRRRRSPRPSSSRNPRVTRRSPRRSRRGSEPSEPSNEE